MTARDHIQDIACEEVLKHLVDYLHGEVDGGKLAEIEKHLDSCRSCFSRAEFEKVLKDRLRNESREEMPAAVKERLKTLMDRF